MFSEKKEEMPPMFPNMGITIGPLQQEFTHLNEELFKSLHTSRLYMSQYQELGHEKVKLDAFLAKRDKEGYFKSTANTSSAASPSAGPVNTDSEKTPLTEEEEAAHRRRQIVAHEMATKSKLVTYFEGRVSYLSTVTMNVGSHLRNCFEMTVLLNATKEALDSVADKAELDLSSSGTSVSAENSKEDSRPGSPVIFKFESEKRESLNDGKDSEPVSEVLPRHLRAMLD